MHSARVLSFVVAAGAMAAIAAPRSARAQESALGALKTAARASASDASASLAYGRALRRAGRYVEATQELKRAVMLARGPLAIEARYEIARVSIDHGDHNRAMAECRAVGTAPGGASASHACAADVHILWRRASEALLETEKALADGTQSYEAKLAEGRAFELQLNEKEAERSFREAIAWKPDAVDGHLHLGRLLAHGGKHADGVVELKRALALDNDNPEANYEIARVMGPTLEAAALLENAVHERPNYGDALRKLAEVDIQLDKLPEARKAAEAALKADPNDAGSHMVMGRVALRENKPDDAIKEGQAALAVVANSAHAKLLIADAYAKKGEVDLAVESYQAAYGFDHTEPASLVHASQACHAAGRETSAKAFGEKATKEFPEWAPGWVALGDALVANKEVASARAAYETALRSRGPLDAASVRSKLDALK